jgi:hypothetical protein
MNKFTEYLLNMVLGVHGRTEYQRVKTDKHKAEQQRLRNIRD